MVVDSLRYSDSNGKLERELSVVPDDIEVDHALCTYVSRPAEKLPPIEGTIGGLN